MSDVLVQMGSAIYARLDAQLAGSVYYALAPQTPDTGTVTYPLVIYQQLTGMDEYTFDGTGHDAEYIVKAVSNRKWPTEAHLLYGSAHAAINQVALTYAGHVGLRCERTSVVAPYRDQDGYWHVGGIYRVETWES